MTCDFITSAIAVRLGANILGQKVNELGCPVRTRDGEDGSKALRVKHDSVSLQSGRQRGLDLFDVDLPSDAVVHWRSGGQPYWAHGVTCRHA